MDVVVLILPPSVHVSPVLGAALVLVFSIDRSLQSVFTGQVANGMALLP